MPQPPLMTSLSASTYPQECPRHGPDRRWAVANVGDSAPDGRVVAAVCAGCRKRREREAQDKLGGEQVEWL